MLTIMYALMSAGAFVGGFAAPHHPAGPSASTQTGWEDHRG